MQLCEHRPTFRPQVMPPVSGPLLMHVCGTVSSGCVDIMVLTQHASTARPAANGAASLSVAAACLLIQSDLPSSSWLHDGALCTGVQLELERRVQALLISQKDKAAEEATYAMRMCSGASLPP